MAVLTLVGWSSVPLFLRHFAQSIDAWTSNGWRYGFSALLWLPVVVIASRRGRLPAGIWRLALVPSALNAIGQVCFTWAHYKIDPGLLTFGMRVQIVFVAIGAYLLFPFERRLVRTPAFIFGVAMVLAGTAGAALMGDNPFARERLFGVTLAVGAGGFFAAYGLAVRHYMHGLNPVLAFAVISQYTAIIMVGLMVGVGKNFGAEALALSASEFSFLLFSAIVGIALGHVFYYTSIAKLGVATTVGVLQLQPFLVAISSLAIFSERLSATQWVGGLIAVGGALLMLRVQQRLLKTINNEDNANTEGTIDGASAAELEEAFVSVQDY